jgi:autotransporter-associated beta strand protein
LFTNVNFGGTNSMTFGAAVNGQNNERAITNNLPAGQTLTFSGTTTIRGVGDGVNRVFIVGGAGNTVFNNTVVDGGTAGTGGLTINSTGTTTLAVANTYTGPTTVNAGVLMLSNTGALGSGNLRLDTGGVVGLNAGDFTSGTGSGAGQVRIVTSGGFAAFGADRVVAFGGTSAPTALTWGGGLFLGSSGTFVLGAPGATATLDFRNAIALGAAGITRQVRVNDGTAALDAVMSGSLTGAANLAKTGQGTLRLTGLNTFTGTAAIQAGTLEITATSGLRDTARVTIDGGATFRYAGSTATFGRPITVTAASGTGTIENTGGGVLTLSGAISKDNSVLRLAGGVFNVTGVISGATPNASDLLVTGTSTVTLSNVNTYDGPTFVNQSSNLILGVTGAIPNNSIVTVGDATTTGTLTLGAGVTDAIGGLSFGTGGGTLRISATSTSGAPLTSAGTMTLTDGTLDLADSGSTAGLYNVLSGGVVSGTFTSVANSSPAYQVIYSSTSVDYQQRAVAGTVNVTNPAVAIITGGTAAFTYTVTNTALSGGATLSFTGSGASNVGGSSSGSVAAGGTSSAVSGLFYNGVSTGSNQTGTFTVSDPNAFGTAATGTVTVNVYAHASGSAAGATIALPQSIVGYSGALSGLTSATILNAAGYRADLMTTGGTAAGSVTINNVAGVLPGQSALISASALLSGSQSVGANSLGQVFNLTFADDSSLSGASNSLGSQAITVTGNVLDHALPGFVPVGNVVNSYTDTVWNIDFGSVDQSAGMQTFNYFLTNLSSLAHGPSLTAGLDFTFVTLDGDGFSSGLTTFSDLAAGGTSSQFAFTYTPSGLGTFNKTFTLTFYDNQSLAGATQRRDLTINASVVVVPEPATLALAAAGVGMALLARARRRHAA